MALYRKIKKELKKIYKEALIKDTIPKRYGLSQCALICYRGGGYYPLKFKDGKPIWSKRAFKSWDVYEITFHHYDEWNREHDSWCYKDRLISKNKETPYPTHPKKIKSKQLKFFTIDV